MLRLQGETEVALGRAEAAIALPFDDPALRADLLNVAATLHSRSGDQRAAIGRLEEALAVADAVAPERKDPLLAAQILNSLGVAHQRLGEQQEAIEAFRQVLAVARRMGSTAGEGVALTNLANSHYQLGELETARQLYAEVMDLRRTSGDAAGEARALSYLGWAEASLGRHADAEGRFLAALEIHRRAGDRRAEADTLTGLAFTRADLGRWRQADADAGRALELAGEGGDPRIATTALLARGTARRGLGREEEALAAFRDALEHARRGNDRLFAAEALSRIARLERHRGDLPAARGAMEEAVGLVESLRSDVTGEQLRTSFLASRNDYYRFLVDVLMAQHRADPAAGHAAEALAVHERARARSLLDLLAEAGAEIRRGVDPELLAEEQELLAAIEAAEGRLAAAGADDRAAASELAELLDRYQDLLATLRARSPRYAALAEPQPLDAAAIRDTLLDEGTLLLEIALGDETSHLWAVDSDGLAAFELPPRQAVEAEARALHEALSARNRTLDGETPAGRRERFAAADAEAERRARALAGQVLSPVAGLLEPGRRLVVVADGALQYVPFGLLPHPASEVAGGAAGETAPPLLEGHEIVSLPSASVLAVLRREADARRRPRHVLAVVADPVFRADDPRVTANASAPAPAGSPALPGGDAFRRLRFSGREAAGIAELVPPQERWVAEGFEASRAAVVSGGLADYRLVHFATHAVIDERQPHRSGLVLSTVGPGGEPANGFLRLHDVYQLDLAAELVTLSACETAHGQEIRGEGLVGLVRGFMYAGAERVVASQWSVEDRATSVLMQRFYTAVLERGLPPSAALRAAQLSLRAEERWSAPYYWAPFVLQGEWR